MQSTFVSMFDREGRLIWTSDAAPGVDNDDITGRYLWEWGDEATMREIHARCLAGESLTWRVRCNVMPGGPAFSFACRSASLVEFGGQIAACVISNLLQYDFHSLSETEGEILRLSAQEMTAAEVGEVLHRSSSSIATALHRMRVKLGCPGNNQLFHEAAQWYNAEYDATMSEVIA